MSAFGKPDTNIHSRFSEAVTQKRLRLIDFERLWATGCPEPGGDPWRRSPTEFRVLLIIAKGNRRTDHFAKL